MLVTITIIRYKKRYIFFALMAMAIHRLSFLFNQNISFYKLLGCGKNGTFDKHPDWQQWGIIAVHKITPDTSLNFCDKNIQQLYGSFIFKWIEFFNCETWTVFLEPLEGHGVWDGKPVFGSTFNKINHLGVIAVLTRATIRISKLNSFWKNVDAVARQMNGSAGFIFSIGIGELPFIKQATFSIWKDSQSMKKFAYQMQEHTEVIKKTRKENWYSEEMFVRFKPIKSVGSIKGCNPLEGML